MFPVVDLHCDLLSYLAEEAGRTPHDVVSRAAYPQLHAGGVQLQTTAIFSTTGAGSAERGEKQVELLRRLFLEYPLHFTDDEPTKTQVQLIAAFENAAGFAEETEPLDVALRRLEQHKKELKRIFYITLTWNEENRFGGGNETKVGLKEDGKKLLDWLHDQEIAVDLSHTSDKLAEEVLAHIDQCSLKVPVMASHSNFRAVTPMQRNLPDWLAREIIRRKGLIGLNFFAPFIRIEDPDVLLRHVEYGLNLGGENALCFGADFFHDDDFSNLKQKYRTEVAFFPEYGNASCYPSVLELLSKKLQVSREQLHKLASGNALNFIERLIRD